jgi:integrase
VREVGAAKCSVEHRNRTCQGVLSNPFNGFEDRWKTSFVIADCPFVDPNFREVLVKSQDGSRRTTWDGGYIRHGKKRDIYVIERWVGGTKFHISTRCSTSGAAHEQLKRFEEDPVNYRPSGRAVRGVFLTAELVLEFKQWMVKVKKNSPEWSSQVARMLGQWIEDLGARDIKSLNIQRDLKPALDKRKTSRKHRIEAIKAFCGWLRTERGLLTMKDDPTLDLPVPQDDPAQHKKKRAVTAEAVSAVLPFLDSECRDILTLLAGTGWHISEVRRFATDGELIRNSKGGVVAKTRHKSKRMHPTLLQHEEHIKAATAILKRGTIPAPWTLSVSMREACTAAGVDQFRMGVMRHTVATHAVEEGAPIEEVSSFLGHKSKRTTERFYVDMNVPAKSVPVLQLVKKG